MTNRPTNQPTDRHEGSQGSYTSKKAHCQAKYLKRAGLLNFFQNLICLSIKLIYITCDYAPLSLPLYPFPFSLSSTPSLPPLLFPPMEKKVEKRWKDEKLAPRTPIKIWDWGVIWSYQNKSLLLGKNWGFLTVFFCCWYF